MVSYSLYASAFQSTLYFCCIQYCYLYSPKKIEEWQGKILFPSYQKATLGSVASITRLSEPHWEHKTTPVSRHRAEEDSVLEHEVVL